MTSLWRDPQASPGVPACTAHTAPESSGGVKVTSAGLSAWVSWSRSFQTPLFLQELSKGGNGANKRSWPSWGWCVVCPTDKGRFCPCEGSSEVEKDGKPSSELSLWRTMEITSPSWVLLSWVLGPSLYQQHPAAKSGSVHCPVHRGKGREGGKEERESACGGGQGRNWGDPVSFRSDSSGARVPSTPPSCLPSSGPNRLFNNSQNFQPNVSHIQEPKWASNKEPFANVRILINKYFLRTNVKDKC